MLNDYVKLVSIMKKKDGISFAEFKDHYENVHVGLARTYPEISAPQQHAFRRYLRPLGPGSVDDRRSEDVILEVWFKSIEDVHATMRAYSDPAVHSIILADEAKFLDQTQMRHYILEECHTDWT